MKTTILAVAATMASAVAAYAINVPNNGFTYGQDFNGLASSGTGVAWANDSTLSGWHLFRQPAPGTAITSYDTSTGTSTTGSVYSYGSDAADRALGGLGSGGAYFGNPGGGAVAGWIAVAFQNTSGGLLTGFTATWNGEQWRNSASAAQTMVFDRDGLRTIIFHTDGPRMDPSYLWAIAEGMVATP